MEFLTFLSFAEDAESWPAEGGANAAIVELGGEVHLVRGSARGRSAALADEALVPDG